MTYDFLAIIDVFGRFMLYGIILRYIISFVPEGLRQAFEGPALYLRTQITNIVEGIWPDNRNFEVVFLSRIAAPFALLVMINSSIFYNGQIILFLSAYPFLNLLVFIINIFIFLNVAPTVDDFKKLVETDSNSKLIFILKIALIISFISELTNQYLVGILLIPVSGNGLEIHDEEESSEW